MSRIFEKGDVGSEATWQITPWLICQSSPFEGSPGTDVPLGPFNGGGASLRRRTAKQSGGRRFSASFGSQTNNSYSSIITRS
jgi:hypothetical protein